MISSLLHKKLSGGEICRFSLFAVIALFSFNLKAQPQKTGTLKISFIHTANGKSLVLEDSLYSNFFGEQYRVSKLKYYVGNVLIAGSGQLPEMDPYHLISAANEDNSFNITLYAGNYQNIQFLLGVDSARNCSGAQTGALDPTNDMFWTWSSGYVMFKLEGTSTSSTADLQRIEHHVGGYKGDNNVATTININFPQTLSIKANTTTELVIETNLDHYWKGTSDIRISDTPMWMTMGGFAKKIAANFPGLFSIQRINQLP